MIKIDGIDPKMIANNLIPFESTHPGEVLKDEIEFRGISQKKLAKEMGVSYTVLNEILNAKRLLNTEYAMLIEAALVLDAEPLLRMQTSYNLQMAKKDSSLMEKINKVRKIITSVGTEKPIGSAVWSIVALIPSISSRIHRILFGDSKFIVPAIIPLPS